MHSRNYEVPQIINLIFNKSLSIISSFLFSNSSTSHVTSKYLPFNHSFLSPPTNQTNHAPARSTLSVDHSFALSGKPSGTTSGQTAPGWIAAEKTPWSA